MSSQKCRSRTSTATKSTRSSKYDDWVCVLCHNHNYSFRMICNRCHTQTKQHNSYLLQFYQENLQNPTPTPIMDVHPLLQPEEGPGDGYFPSVVLLMVSDDPWEEQPYRWEHSQAYNQQWVSTLIEGE